MNKVFTIFFVLLSVAVYSQQISSVKIQTESGSYNSEWTEDSILSVTFKVIESEQIVYVSGELDSVIATLQILPSVEYHLVDSLHFKGTRFYCKLKFRDVIASRFLNIVFDVDGKLEVIDLHPYSEAEVEFRPSSSKLIIGEQKEFELYSSIPNNILPSKRWVETPKYDYFIAIKNSVPVLSILPKILGKIDVTVEMFLRQPVIKDSIVSRTYRINHVFDVEESTLVFLNFDQPEYVLTQETKTEGVLTLVDNSISLKTGRTYRITNSEGQEEVLIGELYIPKKINRGKAQAQLKLYNYHQRISGYLYVKDVDKPVFVTNFTVRPETTVHNIYTKRQDGIWRLDNFVFPGETVQVKLEGTSLMGEPIHFDGDVVAELDSVLSDDSKLVYTVAVPKGISQKKIDVIKNKTPISKFLEVHEVQMPRKFDFVSLDFGIGRKRISDISKPILHRGSLEFFNVRFNPNKIDELGVLHGKQYFTLKVQLYDKEKKLLESAEIGTVCVCPGDNSVRFGSYDQGDCWPEVIELNDYLHNHTANLDDWASVIIEVKHDQDKYEQPVVSQKVEIILARKVNYDLDLSFPTGLLTKEFGAEEENLNNFSGISLAMVAQISFYQKNKIAKYRPYKIGVGFLAFNMFSMSAEVEERDLGLVLLGSVYPSTTDRRLSFPLFLGGGYFLSKEHFFLLVGPGIRISI